MGVFNRLKNIASYMLNQLVVNVLQGLFMLEDVKIHILLRNMIWEKC